MKKILLLSFIVLAGATAMFGADAATLNPNVGKALEGGKNDIQAAVGTGIYVGLGILGFIFMIGGVFINYSAKRKSAQPGEEADGALGSAGWGAGKGLAAFVVVAAIVGLLIGGNAEDGQKIAQSFLKTSVKQASGDSTLFSD